MKPVRIFRHVACEGPGYLGTVLTRENVPYEIICIDEGIKVPSSLDDISGLIFMGGAMNVTDPLQWISDEKRLIRNAIDSHLPVMGICLGAQLMSAALGGDITHGPGMEIGWHEVSPVRGNETHEWLHGLPEKIVPFHWHADSFSTPPGATDLLHGKCRPHQAFALNNSIAMQFHLEMTIDMVEEWVRQYKSDLMNESGCIQDADEILAGLENRITALHQWADILYQKWIKRLSSS